MLLTASHPSLLKRRLASLRGWSLLLLTGAFFLFFLACAKVALAQQDASGLSPESPEVRELVATAVAFLEDQGDTLISKRAPGEQLGARCAVALALYKSDRAKHPLVGEAIQKCREETEKVSLMNIYSHGLAIIFLSEVAPRKERETIHKYLASLYQKQKEHGGWGYSTRPTGDTSQTQYMALGLWEAHANGIRVERDAITGMIDWLVRTQDPGGAWGYQGKLDADGVRATQRETSCTMASAALSSLMIGADLFGVLQRSSSPQEPTSQGTAARLPQGIRLTSEVDETTIGPVKLNAAGIDWSRAFHAMDDGDQWMESHFKLPATSYPYYYLYSLERYKSFLEYRRGIPLTSADWYDKGYAYLKENQSEKGSWRGRCGTAVSTAFGILFLQRSTQKSLKRRIGEGAMQSGRGLPSELAGARLRGGRVVAPSDPVGIAQFLSLVDDNAAEQLDQLADNPNQLLAAELTGADIERLRRLLRGAEGDVRLLATRALARLGQLDNVPSLLYAMTDPDSRVVLAARDGLRLVSRRPLGFGLPDEFDEGARYGAIDRWKRWYLDLRPAEVIDLE